MERTIDTNQYREIRSPAVAALSGPTRPYLTLMAKWHAQALFTKKRVPSRACFAFTGIVGWYAEMPNAAL